MATDRDQQRWRRVEALFLRAVDLDAPARAAWLAAECGDDAVLRAEVEALLQGDAADGARGDPFSRLEAHTRVPTPDPLLARTLGAYRLTARLATGGMGVIYRGERADGLFEQEVAIKLIRAEHASDWLLRRFEFERRTLAALQHPNIARLYDGGTADGCPYFVMELVRGVSLDHYCERERLPLHARLRLFVQVCRAVHFAHQNLVVHCDLKPGNILIDEAGAPRLLDFGIARLLDDASAAATPGGPRTLLRPLTPEYASPEQLAGGAVTTAVDVYALGVILYELVTERPLFEHATRSLADWERIVRERSPEPPSTRVVRVAPSVDPAALAAHLRSTPAALRRSLRGDLDRIVLMALRKEPERRYASAQELADDLERHLAGQPVHARANSLLYRAGKFVRRNRVAVAAAALVVLALAAGLFAAQRSARLALAHAEHATMEADSFQSIGAFLMDAFLPAQPAQDAAWLARARAQIVAHAERVHRQYAQAEHMQANLLDALGHVCLRLDLDADAEPLLREAAALREATYGAESLEYALSLRSLGRLHFARGEYAAAADVFGKALRLHRAAPDQAHADVASVANDLAACLRNLGEQAQARALHEEALALRRAAVRDGLPVAESLNNLAGVQQDSGDLAAALAALREALAIRSRILGERHSLTLQTTTNLAIALWRSGEVEAARAQLRRAEDGYRAIGGDGEEALGQLLNSLASMQLAAQDLDGAAASLEEASALQVKRLGTEHPLLVATRVNLAVLHHRRGKDDLARELWLDIVRARRNAGAPRALAEALYGFGVFAFDVGDHALAQRLLEESAALHRAQQPVDSLALGRVEHVRSRGLLRQGDLAAALPCAEAAEQLLEAAGAPSGERQRARSVLDEIARRRNERAAAGR